MESKKQNNKQAVAAQIQGFITDVKVYVNKDTGTIVHRAGESFRLEMPVNLYKKILGISFEKKQSVEEVKTAQRRVVFGAIVRPAIYLSEDGQYLIHRMLGTRISKHINYYKQILGAEYTPKTKIA